MDMHQIRYFLAACDTLNFARAAERCRVSPPSLSRAISALEGELGGQLFRRERHLTHLTDLGRLMQGHLSRVQAATEAATRDAEAYRKLDGTRLKLGIFASIGAEVLARFLAALGKHAPELELHVWEANCEELDDALLSAEIDVAVSSSTEFDERLRTVTLFEEPYDVAFARGHRFEGMNAVPMRELEGEAYVKRLHCEFPSNFARLGVAKPYNSVRVRYIGEREDWVQAMVRAGLGVTLMPRHLPFIDGVLTRPLIDPAVARRISLVTVAGRPHSPPVAAAVRVATQHAWPRGDAPGSDGDAA